jgi:hypothetical protein
VLFRLEGIHRELLTYSQLGEPDLPILELGFGIVRAFDIRTQEPGERDHLAARCELGVLVIRLRPEPHLDTLPGRVRHLRRDRSLPDQLVELRLVTMKLAGDVLRQSERLTCRADRLVGFLRVLDLALVLTRLVGDVVLAVHLDSLRARGLQRLR